MRQEDEDAPWTINISDHVACTDSAGSRASKKLVTAIFAILGADVKFLVSAMCRCGTGGRCGCLMMRGGSWCKRGRDRVERSILHQSGDG
jgi:hypothetical protein